MKLFLKKTATTAVALTMIAGLMPLSSVIPAKAAPGSDDKLEITVPATTTIEAVGGVVTYRDTGEIVTGKVNPDDILTVTLTEQPGREFLYWISSSGAKMPQKSFDLIVRYDDWFSPVFKDTIDYPYGKEEVVLSGDCTQGTLYKRENEKGDVCFRLDIGDGNHYYYSDSSSDYKYIDKYTHNVKCSDCDSESVRPHEWDYEVTVKPTHTEEGLATYTCMCGASKTEKIGTTDEHTLVNEWIITEPSVNGEYGKRKKVCQYCDYEEEYWYLEPDYLGLLKDHVTHYSSKLTGGSGYSTDDEYFFCYTNDEGNDVYLWAYQWAFYQGNKNDGTTYMFMFTDDHDKTKIKPIYITKSRYSNNNLSSANPTYNTDEYIWAEFAYTYDAEGWLRTIEDWETPEGCNQIENAVLSGTGTDRCSDFMGYGRFWADAYNEILIPTSESSNPAEYLVKTGKSSWNYGGTGIYRNDAFIEMTEETDLTEGFECDKYVRGDSEIVYVDSKTGVTLKYSDNNEYQRPSRALRKDNDGVGYMKLVSEDEYNAADEEEQEKLFKTEDIADKLKAFAAKRAAVNDLTLEIPDEKTGYRVILMTSVEAANSISNIGLHVYFSGSTYNSSPKYYPNVTDLLPSGCKEKISYKETEDFEFDRYEIWNFEKQEWELLSEEPEYEFEVNEVMYIRLVEHRKPVSENLFRVELDGGYFYIGDDYENKHTSADLKENTKITIYSNDVEYKELDYWEDEDGNPTDYKYDTLVKSDMKLKAVYKDTVYNREAEVRNGQIRVDDEEYMSFFCDYKGTFGSVHKMITMQEPGSEYTQFLGWYTFSQYAYPRYNLISKELTIDFTLTEEYLDNRYPRSVIAIWTEDGTFDFDETGSYETYVENGFICKEGEMNRQTPVSVMLLDEYDYVEIIDDPTDSIDIIGDNYNMYYVNDAVFDGNIAKFEFSGTPLVIIEAESEVGKVDVSNPTPKNGEEVTLTAESLALYTFNGWYSDGELVSTDSSFTFTVDSEDGDLSYEAKYEPKRNGKLTIFGDSFTVNDDEHIFTSKYEDNEIELGTEFTVKSANEGFVSWTNESGKVLSKQPEYTFKVLGDTVINMNCADYANTPDSDENKARVEFVSDYDQIVEAKTYGTSDTIKFPEGPTKAGYKFIKWNLTSEEIQEKILAGESRITVKPVYEHESEKTYTVSIYINGNLQEKLYDNYAGDIVTVNAPDISEAYFSGWYDSEYNLLGTSKEFKIKIKGDIEISAEYDYYPPENEIKPMVTISGVTANTDGSKNKVSFEATRSIPDGYKLVEHGMLYSTDKYFDDVPTADSFELGSENVSRYTSNDNAPSSVLVTHMNVTGNETVAIYARAYMLVETPSGSVITVYSDISSASYNSLIG